MREAVQCLSLPLVCALGETAALHQVHGLRKSPGRVHDLALKTCRRNNRGENAHVVPPLSDVYRSVGGETPFASSAQRRDATTRKNSLENKT